VPAQLAREVKTVRIAVRRWVLIGRCHADENLYQNLQNTNMQMLTIHHCLVTYPCINLSLSTSD